MSQHIENSPAIHEEKKVPRRQFLKKGIIGGITVALAGLGVTS